METNNEIESKMVSNRAINNCISTQRTLYVDQLYRYICTEILWNMYQDMYTITFISKTASCEMQGVNKFLLLLFLMPSFPDYYVFIILSLDR